MRKLLITLVLIAVAATFADAGQVIKRRPVEAGGGGGADYVVTDGYLYLLDTDTNATAFRIAIYNNAGSLVATSDESEIVQGWATVTFTAGPTIAPGSLYYLAIMPNNDYDIHFGCAGLNYDMKYRSFTYPTAGATINPTTDSVDASGSPAIYITNSTAVMLVGDNSTAGRTSLGGTSSEQYYTAGYTAITQ
jgi:hypothetical protein